MFYGGLTGFGGGGGAAGFLPLASGWGSDYMTCTSTGFSGSTNFYSYFFWIKNDSWSGSNNIFSTAAGSAMPSGNVNTSGQIGHNHYLNSGNYFYVTQTSTGMSVDTWHYVHGRINVGTYDWKLWIDGVDQSWSNAGPGSGWTITNLDENFFIGANGVAHSGPSDFYLSEFWMDDTDIDMDSSAVRDAFVLAGAPVDFGADGSGPTGSQPNVYCSIRSGGSASDFGTNRGSGGDFTITGTLDLVTDGPGT